MYLIAVASNDLIYREAKISKVAAKFMLVAEQHQGCPIRYCFFARFSKIEWTP